MERGDDRIRNAVKYCHDRYLDLAKGWRRSGLSLQKDIHGFCNRMKGHQPGRYRYSSDSPESAWASAFAALTLDLIGRLSSVPDHERKEWIRYLQSFQDEETGIFVEPGFNAANWKSAVHSRELFLAHSSTFIMGALIVLGSKPLHPIRWVHEYREPSRMKQWIEALPWQLSPWLVGNWTYDIGCAMGMDFLVTKDPRNFEGMEAFFAWHDEHQLSDTGWWDLTGKASLEAQLYGGYHTLTTYRCFGRPIPKADRMIETSLLIQKADGLFGQRPGGGCCEDMDTIDVLVSLGQATMHKREQVRNSLERALYPLLRKQNSDGGFYDKSRSGRSEFGWESCSARRGRSEFCSTLFQSFSISLIAEFLNDGKLLDTTWNHHRTYCHCECNIPVIPS